MNHEKVNKGNRGFTLVEVLIATAILGIMVGPILTSFVSVARVNTTSRKRLSATTAGESVAEAVKAFSLYDVAKQCDYPSQGFTLLAGELTKDGKNAFSGSASELTKDATGNYVEATNKTVDPTDKSFKHNSSGYIFIITDIPMGGSKYDAIVTYTEVAKPDEDNRVGTKEVKDILDEYSVRTLNYYQIEIVVYKSSTADTINGRLAEYNKPLAKISGTKADYN